MTSTQRVWLTAQAHERLRQELAELLTLSATADAGEQDEQTAMIRRRREARIRQIQDLLATAVVGEDPPDDGIAEPGMVLTVHYDDTGETETFLLAVRNAEYGDIEVLSPDSPLGMALIGARRGEQRSYQVPSGATVRVTLLDAVPYGHYRAQSNPA